MRITASVNSSASHHHAEVSTQGTRRSLAVPVKETGPGSSVNGGEFLMLALATCYCNDLWREAKRLGLLLEAVEVEAEAVFADRGLAASDVRYRARVRSPEPAERIEQLLKETDAVAEVHNTLRAQVPVVLVPWSTGGESRT